MRYYQQPGNVFCILSILLLMAACKTNEFNNNDPLLQNELLLQDANAFCDIHTANYWADLPPDMSISEFNTQVKAKLKSVLKTEEFLTLLDDMDSVEFYREMYSTAKGKVESLTGTSWNCPAYQTFYELKSQPVIPKQSKLFAPQIIVNTFDQYSLHGKPLNLSTDKLKVFINSRINDKVDSPIVILVEAGASDMGLQRLIKALSSLQVTNINIINEE